MNRFEVGQARLNQLFLANASITITYHKIGVATPIVLKCWPGTYLFKVMDRDNQRMEWSDRDYLIPRENLKDGTTYIQPAKGDWIEETFPDGVQQYELSAPENEQVWRWSDTQHTVYRVHTKRVT